MCRRCCCCFFLFSIHLPLRSFFFPSRRINLQVLLEMKRFALFARRIQQLHSLPSLVNTGICSWSLCIHTSYAWSLTQWFIDVEFVHVVSMCLEFHNFCFDTPPWRVIPQKESRLEGPRHQNIRSCSVAYVRVMLWFLTWRPSFRNQNHIKKLWKFNLIQCCQRVNLKISLSSLNNFILFK